MTEHCDSVGAVCNLCRTKASRPWVLLPRKEAASWESPPAASVAISNTEVRFLIFQALVTNQQTTGLSL